MIPITEVGEKPGKQLLSGPAGGRTDHTDILEGEWQKLT